MCCLINLRHIVQYACDHWSCYKSAFVDLPTPTVLRLQLESDMVLQRAIVCILSARRSAHMHVVVIVVF